MENAAFGVAEFVRDNLTPRRGIRFGVPWNGLGECFADHLEGEYLEGEHLEGEDFAGEGVDF